MGLRCSNGRFWRCDDSHLLAFCQLGTEALVKSREVSHKYGNGGNKIGELGKGRQWNVRLKGLKKSLAWEEGNQLKLEGATEDLVEEDNPDAPTLQRWSAGSCGWTQHTIFREKE